MIEVGCVRACGHTQRARGESAAVSVNDYSTYCSCYRDYSTMGRSRSRRGVLLVCLVELGRIPAAGGWLSAHAFINSASSSSSYDFQQQQRQRQRHQQQQVNLTPTEGGWRWRGMVHRRRRRSAAMQASHGAFPSLARSPLPPPGGGVYEGEKNEKDKREEADFNRNVGKVVDTLRDTYQHIFDEPLDFDIYTPDLQLRDPVSLASCCCLCCCSSSYYCCCCSFALFCR